MPQTTYHTILNSKKDILQPYVSNNVNMLYKGDFLEQNGLFKNRFCRGLIYSNDASNLFGLSRGYVGITINFKDNICDGVYAPLRYAKNENNRYILWGVNIGQYGAIKPGIEAALTKKGIEFKILSSSCEFSILDTYSNIPPETDAFFEFLWDKNGLDDFSVDTKITMAYRVNGQDIVIANPPISNQSIINYNFCILNTPFLNSGIECTLKSICIRDGMTKQIEDDWQSSSLSSSSMSSKSSQSRSSLSSKSSNSSSSSSSVEKRKLGKYMVLCEFSKLYGGSEIGGDIWVSNDNGTTWTQKTKFEDNTELHGFWSSTAMSSDGKYQLIGGLFRNNGIIGAYPVARSGNYGESWNQINISPSFSYDTKFSVAVSESGKYQTLCPLLTTAAINSGMKILTSSDYGVNFSQKAINRRWSAIAMSGDGRYQTACADGEKIYVSNNFGNAWVSNASSPNSNWTDIAISNSGKYQCAVSYDYILVSKDYGATWSTIASSAGNGNINWNWVDMSSDGQTIIVSNGYMKYGLETSSQSSQYYYSNNFGSIGSWTYINLPNTTNPLNIFGFAVSWDGQNIYHIRGIPNSRQYGFIKNFPSGSLSEGGDTRKWSAITLNK